MNPHLLTPEVQQYLQAHQSASPAQLALAKSPFAQVSSAELAQQVDSRQRCRKKLLLWYDTPGIYYPEKLAIEQASSQVTAQYKAQLLPDQGRIIDLTGGLGIDTSFFARRATTVVHCETNVLLSQIARHNATVLGATNIDFAASDGLAYLHRYPADTFDALYLDPARRVEKRKVFLLEDCVPDVVSTQQTLLQTAKLLLIKSAPLLDITAALQVLGNVREVHVVSVANECKEVLFLLRRAWTAAPSISAVALKNDGTAACFTFTADEEKAAIATLGHPAGYLYEPDAAVLKSGAFKLIGQRYGLKKLHQHTHLYTAPALQGDFIGKIFRITDVMAYGDFKKSRSAVRGNVSTRNFPLKADELRKLHRIGEGGAHHLFFCTGPDNALLVIFASKY